MEGILLESISLYNGFCPLLPWHQERMDRTCQLLKNSQSPFQLKDALSDYELPTTGWYKIRVLYHPVGIYEVVCAPYQLKPILRLQYMPADDLEYSLKWALRTDIEQRVAQKKPNIDDVIFLKNGLLTDTSYCNLACFDGQNWYTPATPLLAGTRRASLLHTGTLQEADLRPADVQHMQKIRLFNALIGWEQEMDIEISRIH